jgi:hypothetical protein
VSTLHSVQHPSAFVLPTLIWLLSVLEDNNEQNNTNEFSTTDIPRQQHCFFLELMGVERVECSPDRISHRKFTIKLNESFVHCQATKGLLMLLQ